MRERPAAAGAMSELLEPTGEGCMSAQQSAAKEPKSPERDEAPYELAVTFAKTRRLTIKIRDHIHASAWRKEGYIKRGHLPSLSCVGQHWPCLSRPTAHHLAS